MCTQGVCIGFVRVEDLSRSARIGNVMVHNSLHWPEIWKIFASKVYGVERFLQIEDINERNIFFFLSFSL